MPDGPGRGFSYGRPRDRFWAPAARGFVIVAPTVADLGVGRSSADQHAPAALEAPS